MNKSIPTEILPSDLNFSDDYLEYHVRFARSSACDLLKEHVIILFGWGGCLDKYLEKYSQIYEEAGCTAFRCIVAPKLFFPGRWNEEKLQSVCKQIVGVMKTLNLTQRSLYFHSFSNAGSTVYLHISTILQSDPNHKFQILGCIFDSAPAKLYASNIKAAVVQAVPGNAITRYSCAFFVVSYMYIATGCTWMCSLRHCDQPSSKRFHMYESLANEPNICPQLFLFSKVDDVCPWESIQEFIEIRKIKGVDVTAVLWEDSPHVKHLVTFKDEYITAIMKFITAGKGNCDQPHS